MSNETLKPTDEFGMGSSSEVNSNILRAPIDMNDIKRTFGPERDDDVYDNRYGDPHINRREDGIEASASDIGYPMPDPEEEGEDTSDYEYLHSGFGAVVPKTPKMRGPFANAKKFALAAVGITAAYFAGTAIMDNVRTPDLDAERVPISQGIDQAPEQEVVAPVVQTPTVEPTPTLAPTEIPDPELTFVQLALMDASIGSFTQDEEGNLLFHAALYNTEVGQNIPVVQQYREVGLDGGSEIWIAPEKYPNAPIVVQDLDTGEIRQGPFRYDNDVRRRLTVSSSAGYLQNPFLRVFRGTVPLAGTIGEFRDPGIWDLYGVSAVLVGDPREENGQLLMAAKSYIGEEEDMLAFNFDLSLGSVDSPDQLLATYTGDNKFVYYFHSLVGSHSEHFRAKYSLLSQVLVSGFLTADSRESIPSSHEYSSNAYYAYENREENSAVISVLKSGGLPEDLSESVNYEDLSLYGIVILVLR